MFESYRSFASVYDEFMDGTDYKAEADKISEMITTYGLSKPTHMRTGESEARDVLLAAEKNLVVDLGCGTGKLTEILANQGYDVMGIDLSEEMLSMVRSVTGGIQAKFWIDTEGKQYELHLSAQTVLDKEERAALISAATALSCLLKLFGAHFRV